jgi:hypothetical protein
MLPLPLPPLPPLPWPIRATMPAPNSRRRRKGFPKVQAMVTATHTGTTIISAPGGSSRTGI